MLRILKCPPLLASIFFKNFKFFVKIGFEIEICAGFAAMFNVQCVAVLLMSWSYVRTAMIVYSIVNILR